MYLIPRNDRGHFELTEDVMQHLAPNLTIKFINELKGLIVQAGDKIKLDYTIKIHETGELEPVPNLIIYNERKP